MWGVQYRMHKCEASFVIYLLAGESFLSYRTLPSGPSVRVGFGNRNLILASGSRGARFTIVHRLDKQTLIQDYLFFSHDD